MTAGTQSQSVLLVVAEVLAIAIAAVSLWASLRAQDRKRRRDEQKAAEERKTNQNTFQAELRSLMHTMDKRLHGIEVTVQPYHERMDKFESRQQALAAQISRAETQQIALGTDIDRLNRSVEALQNQRSR
jgi:chromosome segregation ATPase